MASGLHRDHPTAFELNLKIQKTTIRLDNNHGQYF